MDDDILLNKFNRMLPHLDEKLKRLFLAGEASAIGRGGVAQVARLAGCSTGTIRRGQSELESKSDAEGRVRRPGGGRKRIRDKNPGIVDALNFVVSPHTRGDPTSPLRWTCKSTRTIAEELRRQGFNVSHTVVAEILAEEGYSLQSVRKTREGRDHPDRDAQFAHINARVESFLTAGLPVLSVDCKKKELVGDFKNGGREWQPRGSPEESRVHDFIDPSLGKAIPYGVYDVANNIGWVSVGIDHETSAFAVETIRRWWINIGSEMYPDANRLLICADGGGSNGSRVRLWKAELARFASEVGLEVSVSHLPPGTSKWNKIEHRLFSFITMNWRGRPLVSREVILQLIRSTTTRKGLEVHADIDTGSYPLKVKVSDQDFDRLPIARDDFHGEWNYTLLPRQE